MKKLLGFIVFAGAAYAQTVSGTGVTGTPPQTASAVLSVKKVVKLLATLTCPTVPTCATATSTSTSCIDTTGTLQVIAGTSASCVFAYTNAVVGATPSMINLTSSDTTQFTVPASVTIASGASVSPAFNITATP